MNLKLGLLVSLVCLSFVHGAHATLQHDVKFPKPVTLAQKSAYAVMFQVTYGGEICYENTAVFSFKKAFTKAEKEHIMTSEIVSLIPEECKNGEVRVLGVEEYVVEYEIPKSSNR